MDIGILKHKIETIASKVHDSWWEEKKKQGFHSPVDCKSDSAVSAREHDIRSQGLYEFIRFYNYCDKCHKDMYPYFELPENIKEYDRVTVKTVIKAIEDL